MFATADKHFIIEAHGLAYQVADAMQAEASAVDKMSTSVMAMVPDHAVDMTAQMKNLDFSFTTVVASYADGDP